VSAWSRSGLKRAFDFLCILGVLPILIPVLLAVALAVWLTSRGPVLFLQTRVGRDGRPFTIAKFRTLLNSRRQAHPVLTTTCDQHFTPIGRFLRYTKLDELPQLLQVLAGQMSLVGPRPKVAELEPGALPCRPGITGMATFVFAREQQILDRIHPQKLAAFYKLAVGPAKRQLDTEYMSRANFGSDLRLIVATVFFRWNSTRMESVLRQQAEDREENPGQRSAQLIGSPAINLLRAIPAEESSVA
jgi:lipopolysaccharide/colanic/teichoic acid biosynthesis glycosyltransferase